LIGSYIQLSLLCSTERASGFKERMRPPLLTLFSSPSSSLAAVAFLLLSTLPTTQSFAYAPNFITKIIQEQTGVAPVGLLEVLPVPTDDTNGRLEQPVTVATATATKATQIRTRFPPEPNGYLHLGHAKAVCFNFAVARAFDGVCHMRLDDTNPTKEDAEYVGSILEDVLWIQQGLFDAPQVTEKEDKANSKYPWQGAVRKTSDYFDTIFECAVALIESGDAYVDSLSPEQMREYRGSLTEPGRDSPYRTRTVAENLELFRDMRDGKLPDGVAVVRAKIDMQSPNINLRDPALYRIKHESHQETGDTWCIYPMYDFSHPIADAVEGITHSLCTLEFEDHRPFYDWTVEKLLPTGLLTVQPQQIEFSRLNIQSTVLSKRKLIQLVQERHVSGWDDPRMPTLSGLRRRGVPAAALRLFCERVGISKADSNIEYAVLEDCVREIMDEAVPRAFCVLKPLKVTISNWDSDKMEEFEVGRHPKLEEMGTRTIPFGKTVYIERSDFFDLEGPEGAANEGKPPKGFKRLLPNDKVRLRYAYVIECQNVVRDPETGEPVELQCSYYPDTGAGVTPEGTTRVKGIIHWVEASTALQCTVNQYDRLFSTEEPGKESGDFLKDLNPHSFQVLEGVVVEPSVAKDALAVLDKIKKCIASGEKIYPSSLAYQFERSGYFALDKSSTEEDTLAFNRVVALRDTWGVKDSSKNESRRSRGNENSGQPAARSNNEPVEDIRRVSLRAATILSAEPHPEADSLLVCKVDCGDVSETDGSPEPRTVVAGLAGKISMDDIIGRKVVAVTNLKPAKMRGIESTAMLLAASDGKEDDDEVVELLQVPDSVPNGELVSFEGKEPNEPDPMMKSKGALKAFDRAKAGLKVNVSGGAIYNDENSDHRMMTSGGPVTVKSLTNVAIQ
jgi:glutaminyl-tRNA synthetase